MTNSNRTNRQRKQGDLKVLVARLGPHMYYGVPEILHDAGLLAELCTDFYIGKFPWRFLFSGYVSKFLPKKAKILCARNSRIGRHKVVAFQTFGLRYIWRLKNSERNGKLPSTHLWAAKEFNRLIIDRGLNAANCVYGFRSASLELFEFAKKRGVRTILEQVIAPKAVEMSILKEEYERWPGWEDEPSPDSAKAFCDREASEWDLADQIICGSQFVKESLQQMGVPSAKCKVVPYGVPVTQQPIAGKHPRSPLRILFVGQVGLRKGVPYLLDAMKAFSRKDAICRIVGRRKDVIRDYAPSNVEFVGTVPKGELWKQYEWADVFCLPSLCEGSATVLYEAASFGLPIITTPNGGSPFGKAQGCHLVPVRDGEAIVHILKEFVKGNIKPLDPTTIAKNIEYSSQKAYGNRLLKSIISD